MEVIERAKSGFLGFGSNPAKVRVSYEEENGVPCAKKTIFEEEVSFPAPEAEQKPKAEETVLTAAPKQEKKEAPAAPVEEETILAAKPGMSTQKNNRSRSERREKSRRSKGENRLQEGDEIIIGSTPKPVAPAPVNLARASEDDPRAAQIRSFLTGLMEHLNVQASPEIFVTDEGNYKVVLQGQDLGAIIGRRGETLDAIQQLTSYSVNRGMSKRVRIHVDAEGYRAKREESLQRLAVKVAGKVVKYRKNMTLEPMNAYERHVIHTALQEYPNVTTYSTGVEPNRRTVVAYAPGQK